MHIYSSRPYLTVYFETTADLAANAPARFGHAANRKSALIAASRRVLARDFTAALVFCPAREQIARITSNGRRVTISGELG